MLNKIQINKKSKVTLVYLRYCLLVIKAMEEGIKIILLIKFPKIGKPK